jgi:hypothetical protein
MSKTVLTELDRVDLMVDGPGWWMSPARWRGQSQLSLLCFCGMVGAHFFLIPYL